METVYAADCSGCIKAIGLIDGHVLQTVNIFFGDNALSLFSTLYTVEREQFNSFIAASTPPIKSIYFLNSLFMSTTVRSVQVKIKRYLSCAYKLLYLYLTKIKKPQYLF